MRTPFAWSPQKRPPCGRPAHVVDDQQIEPAVVVVVEPAGSRRPFAAGDARPLGDVLEAAVAAIAQQLVARDAGDEEIDVAVVVVVGGRRTHGVSDAAHAGRRGHVGELHAAVVAIEPVGVAVAALDERRHLGAVGEEDVGPAVGVVVEDRHAARDALRVVLVGGGGMPVDEGHARRGRDIDEAGAGWRSSLAAAIAMSPRRACSSPTGGRQRPVRGEWDRGRDEDSCGTGSASNASSLSSRRATDSHTLPVS